METEKKIGLAEVWVGVRDPRQAGKVEHDLVELLVVAVAAVLAGADPFVEIEAWENEKRDWLRQYLKLAHGIASHDRAAWPWATPLVGYSRRLVPTSLAQPFAVGSARYCPRWAPKKS